MSGIVTEFYPKTRVMKPFWEWIAENSLSIVKQRNAVFDLSHVSHFCTHFQRLVFNSDVLLPPPLSLSLSLSVAVPAIMPSEAGATD